MESSSKIHSAIRTLNAKDADWLEKALSQLDHLAKLPANWDSYGAKPVHADSLRHARQMLKELAKMENLQAPLVTASTDGNAALNWDDGKQSLDVEVYPDGRFVYAYLNEEDPSKEEEGSTTRTAELIHFLT